MPQNRICRIITRIGYENADHPSLSKELGLLSIGQLISLDLGVLMFKVNEGLTHGQDQCVTCFNIWMLFTSTEPEVPLRATSI